MKNISPGRRLSFLREVQELVNKYSKENDGDPDFILAQYLNNCLTNFNLAQQQHSSWYSGAGSEKKKQETFQDGKRNEEKRKPDEEQ